MNYITTNHNSNNNNVNDSNTDNKNIVSKKTSYTRRNDDNFRNYYYPLPKRKCCLHSEKITDDNFVIPQVKDYEYIINKNYRVSHLKRICKHYKQKVSGNKEELRSRIFHFLRLSLYAIKIQRCCIRSFLSDYNSLHGPAKYLRSNCVNETDFVTMDSLKEIPYNYFFSYRDDKGKIYGFNIVSLWTLFQKPGEAEKVNPYNREPISGKVVSDVKKMIKLSACNVRLSNGGEIITMDANEPEQLTPKQQIEAKTIELFQKMDMLGHYTDTQWFLTLDRSHLIQFIRNLADIWSYRASLSQTVKREICPPYGDPFRLINLYGISFFNIITLQRISLSIIDKLITNGINQDSRYLGSTYVLCAFTLVNCHAAESLPWLYDSVLETPP